MDASDTFNLKKLTLATLKSFLFSSPTLTGTVTLPATTSIGTITSTELGYIDGATSNIQTQINGKQAGLVSGTNIKTVNGNSLLGSGNLVVSGGGLVPPSLGDNIFLGPFTYSIIGYGPNIWFTLATFKFNISGSVKITYRFSFVAGTGSIYFQLFKNGVALSSLKTLSSYSSVDYIESYSFNQNDVLSIQGKVSAFNIYSTTNPSGIIQNFSIKTAEIYSIISMI